MHLVPKQWDRQTTVHLSVTDQSSAVSQAVLHASSNRSEGYTRCQWKRNRKEQKRKLTVASIVRLGGQSQVGEDTKIDNKVHQIRPFFIGLVCSSNKRAQQHTRAVKHLAIIQTRTYRQKNTLAHRADQRTIIGSCLFASYRLKSTKITDRRSSGKKSSLLCAKS